MAIRSIFLFFLTGIGVDVFSQVHPHRELNLNQYIEELFAVPDEDINYEELYETFFLLYQNPINLNKVTKNELQSLYILSEIQTQNFFDYIDENGPLVSIYELQAIPGFDLLTVYKMLPFVTVHDLGLNYSPKPLIKRILEEKNNMLIIRYERGLEDKKGFILPDTNELGRQQNRYLGSADKIYTRFRVSHPKDFSLGFTMEKDAGEKVYFDRKNKAYGMDFYSYHFLVHNKGKLKTLALGDYQLQIGQSLLLGAGFIVGKGSETINTLRRSSLGIRPYTSVVESGFFRGAASTFEVGRYIITGFYSNIQQDGNVQQADTLSETPIPLASSIYNTGLHRTQREIASKNQINEQVKGGNVQYRSFNKKLEVGATFLNVLYNVYLKKDYRVYNQYEFEGRSNHNFGLNYSFTWQNFNFFGEAAMSKSGGMGITNGLVASLTPKVEVSMLMRSFDRNFHSFYGRAFSENSRNINERGTYLGLKIHPLPRTSFTAYYDHFTFPWLKFRVDAPTDGYEYLIRFNYFPSKKILLYAQIREKSKAINVSGPNMNDIGQGIKRNFIFNIDYTVNPTLYFRSRIQSSSYSLQGNTSHGFAILQDMGLHLGKFVISGRMALFDTDDFENRQYVYEKDVLYAFSIPAYNGLGARTYVLVQYKAHSKLQIWCRFAKTRFHDRDFIGSGLERIEGNVRSDVKMQIMYRI